jgi:hypothetical protein
MSRPIWYVIKFPRSRNLVVLDYKPDGGKVIATAYTETTALKIAVAWEERRAKMRADLLLCVGAAVLMLLVWLAT